MKEFAIATFATVLGTVVAMLILRLFGGDRPRAQSESGRTVEVKGDGNSTSSPEQSVADGPRP